jgi:hypothetical protein
LKKLRVARINPTYKTAQVITPVLFSFILSIKSFNELDCMLKENEFNKLEPVEVWKEKKSLRFIKFEMKYPDKKRSQIMIVTTCIEK